MFRRFKTISCFAAGFLAITPLANGQDQTIDASDPALIGFATEVIEFNPATPSSLIPAVTDPSAALGPPSPPANTGPPEFSPIGLTSLGDAPAGELPGSITLGFGQQTIFNGAGGDFAVFENAGDFGDSGLFVELAFVQVSTDGINFAQFDAFSSVTFPDPDSNGPLATDLILEFGPGFATLPDRNLVSGFAGADPQETGTLFDLDSLTNNSLVLAGTVDLNNINFVRLIDIPGDGRFVDSAGNPIFDAFAPNGPTGGFDLDAIGLVNASANTVPEPSSLALLLAVGGLTATRRRRSAK